MELGFLIKCLNCGSHNVSIQEEIDYDWDEKSLCKWLLFILQ